MAKEATDVRCKVYTAVKFEIAALENPSNSSKLSRQSSSRIQ
jgi:hypothetical protein